MRPIAAAAASTIKKVFDNFQEPDGDVVKTKEGSRWNKRRGTWGISSNKVTSSTSASEYPISTVATPMSTKKTISLKGVSQGTGAALWVTDSGNWWAISVEQNGATDCNCQQCQQCNAYQCNATGCVCGWWCAGYGCTGNYNASNCTGYNTSTCKGWNLTNCRSYSYNSKNKTYVCNAYNTSNCNGYNGSNCKGYNASNCNATGCTDLRCGCYGCTSQSCSSYSTVNCNCQTCYPPYIRLIQSASNVVSQVAEWALASVANSVKILLNGRDITVKAYSDTDLTNQIGSDLTYTATGAAITANYGIIVKPSAYNQGSSVDEISIENK